MDRDTNYVAVGAFVLLVIAMAVAFVLWYTKREDKRDYHRYEIYFAGSVSGLSQGGPVRYLGVDVGRVVRIGLDPTKKDQVMVIADIDATAPIDGRTLASLKLQGVTGLLFVDLERGREPAALELATGHQFPVIRSVPSDFDVLLSSLPGLATQAAELLNKLNDALNKESIQAFHATLDNTRRASDALPKLLADSSTLVADMRKSSREVELAAASFRSIADDSGPDIKVAMTRLRTVADNLATTSTRLDRLVADNQANISRFASDGLPEIQKLLREGRDAAREFRDLSRSLKQNPSKLIYEPRLGGIEVPP
jgi:phospholipid/cholesterol/gamma-HCH transport system substrate-binding protein